MMIANRRTFKKGEVILQHGDSRSHLFLIYRGVCCVSRSGETTGKLSSNQFISEQSFTTWRKQVADKLRTARARGASSELIWSYWKSPDPEADSSTTEASSWPIGRADVVCEEDCVVYTWSFPILYEMMVKRPAIGVVMERLISLDLNNKMVAATSTVDQRKTYKQLLTGALMGDKVTETKKKHLEQFRAANGISLEEHLSMVTALGWTAEEFETGYKGYDDNDDGRRGDDVVYCCTERTWEFSKSTKTCSSLSWLESMR